ncbi:hypothetical protein B9S53_08305 [Arthrospira sp. O9.13F]|nr:hypothetical protein B9S53_08305 [Arthrospira sp. O9.13F]
MFGNRTKHYPHPKSGSQGGRGTWNAYSMIAERAVSIINYQLLGASKNGGIGQLREITIALSNSAWSKVTW